MIPMNISLGPKAARFMIDNHIYREMLEQHCLVYTDSLLDKYMDIDEDAAEAMIEYIDAHEGEEGFSKRENSIPGETIEQILCRLAKKELCHFPKNIAIVYKDKLIEE